MRKYRYTMNRRRHFVLEVDNYRKVFRIHQWFTLTKHMECATPVASLNRLMEMAYELKCAGYRKVYKM